MITPPFPTPPRAITHAELLLMLADIKRAEKGIPSADLTAEETTDAIAYYQGQRHLLVRLIKRAEAGTSPRQ